MTTETRDSPFKAKQFSGLVNDMLAHLQQGALNDAADGSVVRTLTEAFAREMAVCYQQLDHVYRFAYLETAEGVALDNVVALLGIKRQHGGHIEGEVTFSRKQPAQDDISIPAGTLVSGRDIPLLQATLRTTLPKGETSVQVRVRSLEASADEIKPTAISIMPKPIWGIEEITNPFSLIARQSAETDIELRERTRTALQQANKGTVASIEIAVRSLGIDEVTVRDQIKDRPGRIEIVLGDVDLSPDLLAEVEKTVNQVRPAGIQVIIKTADRIWVQIHARLELNNDYPVHKKEQINRAIQDELKVYVNGLGNGEQLRWSKISSILTNHAAVMAIHPTTAFSNYLDIYTWKDDQKIDEAGNYQTRNNNVLPGPNQRIGFESQGQAISLALEAPYIDVLLDVDIKRPENPETEKEASEIERISNLLSRRLEGLSDAQADLEKSDVSDNSKVTPILFEALAENLNRDVSVFTLIYKTGGNVIELSDSGDKAYLNMRERIYLRRVRFV
ncbi:baseplate J/gp47 family protein [Pseudomonadota bacterium]